MPSGCVEPRRARAFPGTGQAVGQAGQDPGSGPDDLGCSPSSDVNTSDPYRPAVRRLQSLLAATGDEDELVNAAIAACPPGERLAVELGGGAVLAAGAYVLCRLLGIDPLGGAMPLQGHATAASVGAVAALPLMALQGAFWHQGGLLTPEAEEEVLRGGAGLGVDAALAAFYVDMLFVAEDRLRRQAVAAQGVLVAGMEGWQTLALAAAQAVPQVMLAYPLGMGVLRAALHYIWALPGGGSGADLGPEAPAALLAALPLITVAGVAAALQFESAGAQERELLTVQDASANAERYYRLTMAGRDSTASDAGRAAGAFQAAAAAWMVDMEFAAWAAAVLALLSTLYLGGLYLYTGDVAAPLVACAAANAVALLGIKGSRAG